MERIAFKVIGKVAISNIIGIENTFHNANERVSRVNNIIREMGGYGNALYSFEIDTEHPNGNEIHTITDNGIIIIQNARTKKFVTCLIARVWQIKRYFVNGVYPIEVYAILDKCEEHRKKGWNNW